MPWLTLNILPSRMHSILVFSSWLRSKSELAAQRSIKILELMEQQLNEGQLDVFPDIHTFNQVIITISKSRVGTRESLEMVFRKMDHMYSIGLTTARPDTTSYNCFLHKLAKTGTIESTNAAEVLLESMQTLCEKGLEAIRPNVVSYGFVIDSYANSSVPDAASKGYRLLNKMIYLYQLDPVSNAGLRPNTCIFNNVLKCFGKCKDRDSPLLAENLFREMDRLHKMGLPVKPDTVSYSTVCVFSFINFSLLFRSTNRIIWH